MMNFVNNWNSDSFLTNPIGPLGLIAMPGTEEIGQKVNTWHKLWRDNPEANMLNNMRTNGTCLYLK